MVGEVRLAEHVEPGQVALEVVVDPQPAHRVVDGGVDAHGDGERVLTGDALVHLEEVVVALVDDLRADARDRLGEVEVHAVLQRPDAAAGVDLALRRARRDVARHEVAERRVAALEVVVALVLGDLVGGAGVVVLLRHPDAAVVAQRLAHQRELRLEVVARRDARGVDLRVAGVGHVRAALVRAPDGGDVAVLRVGGEEEDVAVAAGGEHHRVGAVRVDRPVEQVAGDDADGAPVLHHEVEHLGAVVQRDVAERDLVRERLVGTEQQLLAGLAARVERARHLRATERAVVEEAAVLTGERHALRDALVDDVHAHLREAVHVRLAGAVVAALDGVVEQPHHAVAVVVVVLRRVDAALRRDAVRAPRRVVEGERLHLVAELAEAGRGRRAGETGAHHDDLEPPLVGGVHELGRRTCGCPTSPRGRPRGCGRAGRRRPSPCRQLVRAISSRLP